MIKSKKAGNGWIIFKKSGIHGTGVFARKDIPKNIDVIQYTGKVVSRKEGDRRSTFQDKSGCVYVFSLNDKYDIDGLDGGNGAQLINHSCNPNCEAINYDDEEIWLRSIRKIEKGEELTYDYGFEIDCECGSCTSK